MSKHEHRLWTPPGPVNKAAFESGAEIVTLITPVAGGKTSTVFNKALTLSAIQRPGPDGVRRTRFIVVRSTQQRLLSSTLPSFAEWLPETIGNIRKTSPIERHIKTSDLHSEFHFVGVDDVEAVNRVMGMNASAILIDEAREISDLQGVLGQLLTRAGRYPAEKDGGMSFNMRAMIISNTSDRAHDLYRLAVTERPDNCEAFIAPPAMFDRKTINPNAENLKNLNPRFYLTLAATLPEDRFRSEVMNEWVTVSAGKPLTPEFQSSVHVAKTPLSPPKGHPLIVAVDPGVHPAALIGAQITTESGQRQWEIYAELVASNVVSARFAASLKEFVERKWPENPVEVGYLDPVAWSNRDDERLLAELYPAVTGWTFRPPPTHLLDPLLEATRYPFTALVDGGAPAIQINENCAVLIQALSGKVHYREAVSGLETVTTDSVVRPHPWGDVFAALTYMLAGGGGHQSMKALVRDAKKVKRTWREGQQWSSRIGMWVDRATGLPCKRQGAPSGAHMARDIEFPLFGE